MPPVKSQRIAFWVHYVMNPIIHGLQDERIWLQKGNLTWRYWNGEAEYIWPILQYVDHRVHDSYSHFLRHFPQWGEAFEKHDLCLKNSELLAQNVVEYLIQNQNFLALCREKLAMYMAEEEEYPGGAVPQDRFPLLIGERLVNCAEKLPESYTDSDFWSRFGGIFGEAYHRLASELDQQLKESKQMLLECGQKISTDLGDESYRLCEEYDIPANPAPEEEKRGIIRD